MTSLSTAFKYAELFHDVYEELAPELGYETRKESRKPFKELPFRHRALMMFTVKRVLEQYEADKQSGANHE